MAPIYIKEGSSLESVSRNIVSELTANGRVIVVTNKSGMTRITSAIALARKKLPYNDITLRRAEVNSCSASITLSLE